MTRVLRPENRNDGGDRLQVAVVAFAPGGGDAVLGVITELPVNSNFAWVVAQQGRPREGKLFEQRVSRATTLPVEQVAGAVKLERNRIYVVPAGADAVVVNGRIQRVERQGRMPGLDRLLESVAREYGIRAAAVVVPADGGADCLRGIRALKEHGGCVIAQHGRTQNDRAMLEALLQTGCIDEVLSEVGIGERLTAFSSTGIQACPSPFHALPVAAAVVDGTGRVVVATEEWRRLQLAEDAELEAGLRRVLSGEASLFERRLSVGSGEGRCCYRSVIAPAGGGPSAGAVILHLDITEETRRMEAMQLQAAALQSAGSAVLITDGEGKIEWVNSEFERLTGYAPGEVLGRTPDSIRLLSADSRFDTILKWTREQGKRWTGEVTGWSKEGRPFTLQQTVSPIVSPCVESDRFVVSHQDISRHKQAQDRMLYMAEHDELTGLWNRKTFCDRVTEAIERHRRRGGKMAVLFLDLDRFKDTNDTLGHLVGDQMLLEIGRRLKESLREGDVLARFGGDEFVALVEDVEGRESTAEVVGQIVQGFARPIELGGRLLFVTASIGVTMFPEDGETAEELLRNSDLAMYRAKAEGRRAFCFYDQKLEAEINQRVSVERELNRSVGTSDLWVVFQPQWNLKTKELSGGECLLRWEGAGRHGISMGRVVSIAEECGTILPIGRWVIKETVAHLARWQRMGHGPRLSVNLSAVQFHHQDVFGIISEALEAYGVPASSLKAEITESVLLQRSARVKETLEALHQAGIGLILDDFGTGYSSLTYLQQFPIETVKIDASFLRGIGRQKNDEAIVTGIIRMAHSLGQTVVAEGVETTEQLEFLKNCGCDCGQGYLYSHPLSSEEFELFLQSNTPPDILTASTSAGGLD